MNHESFQVIASRTVDIVPIVKKKFRIYKVVKKESVSILIGEVYKMRNKSDMMNVIILASKDQIHYDVDLISGGGKTSLAPNLSDWNIHSSEMTSMKKGFEELAQQHNLLIMNPGDR